jgi:hypothetical protein
MPLSLPIAAVRAVDTTAAGRPTLHPATTGDGAATVPDGAAAAQHSGDLLAAALTASQVACVGAALLPVVLFAPPAADVARHAVGMKAPSAPPMGVVAPPPLCPAGASSTAPPMRGGVARSWCFLAVAGTPSPYGVAAPWLPIGMAVTAPPPAGAVFALPSLAAPHGIACSAAPLLASAGVLAAMFVSTASQCWIPPTQPMPPERIPAPPAMAQCLEVVTASRHRLDCRLGGFLPHHT